MKYDYSLFINKPKLITRISKQTSILLSAPHHASKKNDLKLMATPRGTIRTYDVNTGLICENVAQRTKLDYIICNVPRLDPNKYVNSAYCNTITKNAPKLLIEIHGHAGKSIPENMIEISGGKNNADMGRLFASIFREELLNQGITNVICTGDYPNIFYKADKTLTINGTVQNNSDQNMSLHIELPRLLRETEMVNTTSKALAISIKRLRKIIMI